MINLPKDDAGLVSLALACAEAQDNMAARTSEDSQFWHHVHLAAILRALAARAQISEAGELLASVKELLGYVEQLELLALDEKDEAPAVVAAKSALSKAEKTP